MPTVDTPIELNFVKGIDKTLADWHVPDDSLMDALNVRFNKLGALTSRRGVSGITGAAAPTDAGVGSASSCRIAEYGDTVALVSDKLYTYSNGTMFAAGVRNSDDRIVGADFDWLSIARRGLTQHTDSYVAGSGYYEGACDSYANDDYTVVCWLQSTTSTTVYPYASVFDTKTGATIIGAMKLSQYPCLAARACIVGTKFCVSTIEDVGAGVLYLWTYTSDATGRAWNGGGALAQATGAGGSQQALDVCTDGTYLYAASSCPTVNQYVQVTRYNPTTPAISSKTIAETVNPTEAVAICISNSYLYCIYCRHAGGGSALRGARIATSWSGSFSAPVDITGYADTDWNNLAICPTSETGTFDGQSFPCLLICAKGTSAYGSCTQWGLYMERDAYTRKDLVDASAASSTYQNKYLLYSGSSSLVFPWSKPFRHGSKVYQWMMAPGVDGCMALIDMNFSDWGLDVTNPFRVAGVSACRQVLSSSYAHDNLLPVAVTQTQDTAYTDGFYKYRCCLAITDTVEPNTVIQSLDIDTGWHGIAKMARLGNLLYVSGGLLSVFDGTFLKEAGFVLPPQWVSDPTKTNPGNMGAGSSHRWLANYEEPDAVGNIHIGGPSLVSAALTDAATHYATLTQTDVRLTNRIVSDTVSNVRLVPYRTTDGGTTYFRSPDRTGTITLSPKGSKWGATTPYLTAVDNESDTAIGDNPLHHTMSGAVDSQCPPGMRDICVWRNRLFGIGDDSKTVWYSTEYEPGVAPKFSDALTFQVQTSGASELVAIAPLEDRLILFSSDGIYVASGEPGGADALGATISATLVHGHVGCADSRSIVSGPDGLFFLSKKGFHLLGRDLSVNYIGAPVQRFLDDITSDATYVNDTRPATVLAAVHNEAEQEMIFLCAKSNGIGRTTVLVFNYQWKVWCRRGYYAQADQFGSDGSWDPATASEPTNAVLYGAAMLDGMLIMSTNNPEYYQLIETTSFNDTNYAGYNGAGFTIPIIVTTSWLKHGGVQSYSRMKRVFSLLEKPSGTSVAAVVAIAYDYEDSYTTAGSWTAAQLSTVTSTTRAQVRCIPNRQKGESFSVKVKLGQDAYSATTNSVVLYGLRMLMGAKRPGYKNIPAGAKR